MKKIISSLLVFFLFFLSFSPTFTEDSKNYEKNLIKKELILKHTELAKTTNGLKLANSIDRIIENYKTDEQLLNYLINAISLKLADVKNKTAQNALLYLSYNANYYLLLGYEKGTFSGQVANNSIINDNKISIETELDGVYVGIDGKLYYKGKVRLGARGGGGGSSSSSSSSSGGGGSEVPTSNNCSAQNLEGYNIPALNHGQTTSDLSKTEVLEHAIKISTTTFTCNNGKLTKNNENFNYNCNEGWSGDNCSIRPGGKLTPPTPFLNPDPKKDFYEWFFNYRLEEFGQNTENLITETFGDTLHFETGSLAFWEYNSYNSHAVGYSTNLPSISLIEYGETTTYGKTTEQSDSYYYNHLMHIKDLEEGKTYHFRIKAQDQNGNLLVSPDYTFTTKTFTDDITKITNKWLEEEALQITSDEKTLTHQITKPGTYVLIEDIISDALGINVHSNDVIIDLNGHILVYDNGTPKINGTRWNDLIYNEEATFGIRTGLWNFQNLKIYNGIIKQGKNGGTGYVGNGYNPIMFTHHSGEDEVAGVIVDYYSDSTTGIAGGGNKIHNILYDRGSIVDDRHLQNIAMSSSTEAIVAYNSLRRFRQGGISGGKEIYSNETYQDSFVTNSMAVQGSEGVTIKDNKIFGIGYLAVGIWTGKKNIKVQNNFIYEKCYAPYRRSDEYGRDSGIAGMRATNWDDDWDNQLIEKNIIILKAYNSCEYAKGLWTSDNINNGEEGSIVYRNNTIKTENMTDDKIEIIGISLGGAGAGSDSGTGQYIEEKLLPKSLVFENNHLIGNGNLVAIGDGYNNGARARFYNNTFEKIDHNSEYFIPIRLGYRYWDQPDNRFMNTKWINISEEEKIPNFHGSSGFMQLYYGTKKTLTFVDEDDKPLVNKEITLSLEGPRLGFDFAVDPWDGRNRITIIDEDDGIVEVGHSREVEMYYNGETIHNTTWCDGHTCYAIVLLSDGTYPAVGEKVYYKMSNKTETITIKTDNQGKATFDLSEVEYLRAGQGFNKPVGAKSIINFENYNFTLVENSNIKSGNINFEILNGSDKVQLKEDETITYYCATKPNYENTTFTTGTSTQVNQAWQNIDKNSPCYYTCEDGWSGNNCNINANLKYPYLELVNGDTLNQQTTNTLTFNFYITDPTVITTSGNGAIIYYELSYDGITYTGSGNSSIYVNSGTLNNTPFTFSLDLENITPGNINYKFWAENSLGNTGNIISGSFIKK